MENNRKKKIEICFTLHTDYSVIDAISKSDYTQIYKDIFSNLYGAPSIPFSFALSGGFLEWAQKENSHFFNVLSEMLKRKQIEIIGNAFYEPLLSMIPPSDLIGQIEYMTDILRKHFYKRPRGIYLPYFAWNPNIISNLKKCDIDYCLLDTRFFSKAHLNAFSPVCMEDSGKIIFGIPATKEFENTEASPSVFYDIMLTYASSVTENSIVIFLSPETVVKFLDKSQTGKSWFDEFLELTSNPDSGISMVTAEQLIKQKSIYQKGFIESNAVFSNQPVNNSVKHLVANKSHLYAMYAKIMHVHSLINQMRGDKSRKRNALMELWRAESGILFNLEARHERYNRQLRNCCYRSLLLAEKQSRINGIFTPSLTSLDFDLDGVREFISQRDNINMYIHSSGGKIFELDIFNAYRNYADISAEETGLFIDHLLSADELEAVKKGEFSSAIANPVFSENLYQDIKTDRFKFELQLRTEGGFRSFNLPVSLRKQYGFSDYGVQVQYILKNESKITLSAYFMVEIDLATSPIETKKPQVSVYANDQKQEANINNNKFESVSWIQIYDPHGKNIFTIETNETADLVILPIYEKSGDAKNPIAGLRNLFYWRIDLQPGLETEKLLSFKSDGKKTEKKK
ncbi:alpha-amylase/4-alpha-glucanotransferase domain-containing protein [Treponema pedis]|uniref:Glycosyl hydrolase n=1 Tax=Treponema pedis str. T A4 TaxID=1291379 RepID=S6A1V1_9SPIR|nr:alpha-amylase/4-alpha-glucanotransferase domain-containing protein [Treponema pedis]AGT44923.1 glycosyl hydrolase [Treponema pedis str. T A4]QSI05550.1 DUF1926 domain-containing protein [Treponema pedis]